MINMYGRKKCHVCKSTESENTLENYADTSETKPTNSSYRENPVTVGQRKTLELTRPQSSTSWTSVSSTDSTNLTKNICVCAERNSKLQPDSSTEPFNGYQLNNNKQFVKAKISGRYSFPPYTNNSRNGVKKTVNNLQPNAHVYHSPEDSNIDCSDNGNRPKKQRTIYSNHYLFVTTDSGCCGRNTGENSSENKSLERGVQEKRKNKRLRQQRPLTHKGCGIYYPPSLCKDYKCYLLKRNPHARHLETNVNICRYCKCENSVAKREMKEKGNNAESGKRLNGLNSPAHCHCTHYNKQQPTTMTCQCSNENKEKLDERHCNCTHEQTSCDTVDADNTRAMENCHCTHHKRDKSEKDPAPKSKIKIDIIYKATTSKKTEEDNLNGVNGKKCQINDDDKQSIEKATKELDDTTKPVQNDILDDLTRCSKVNFTNKPEEFYVYVMETERNKKELQQMIKYTHNRSTQNFKENKQLPTPKLPKQFKISNTKRLKNKTKGNNVKQPTYVYDNDDSVKIKTKGNLKRKYQKCNRDLINVESGCSKKAFGNTKNRKYVKRSTKNTKKHKYPINILAYTYYHNIIQNYKNNQPLFQNLNTNYEESDCSSTRLTYNFKDDVSEQNSLITIFSTKYSNESSLPISGNYSQFDCIDWEAIPRKPMVTMNESSDESSCNQTSTQITDEVIDEFFEEVIAMKANDFKEDNTKELQQLHPVTNNVENITTNLVKLLPARNVSNQINENKQFQINTSIAQSLRLNDNVPQLYHAQVRYPCENVMIIIENPKCKSGCCLRVYRQCVVHGTTVPANRYTRLHDYEQRPPPVYPVRHTLNNTVCQLDEEDQRNKSAELEFLSRKQLL